MADTSNKRVMELGANAALMPALDDELQFSFKGVFGLRQLMPLDLVENHVLKRAFDVVFSLIVIVFFLSWMLPILALCIRLTSKGPVFYRQTRAGIYKRTFVCLKLRSMYLDNPEESKEAVRNDPRITPFGKILRKLSLDELPQFFNVVMGDMSVVGPRPHILSQTTLYERSHAHYAIRQTVRPGITGLSQVEGYRGGEITNKCTLYKRVQLDVFYLRKWSFALDLFIILKTIKLVIFGDKHAY